MQTNKNFITKNLAINYHPVNPLILVILILTNTIFRSPISLSIKSKFMNQPILPFIENKNYKDMIGFSKGDHTPSDEVQRRCPLFREIYQYLQNLCYY
jgi:hypothetical protein